MKKGEQFPLWWPVKLPEDLKPDETNSYHFLVSVHRKKTLPVYGEKTYEEYYINTGFRYNEVLIEIDYHDKNLYRMYDNCTGVYYDYKTLSGARSAAHRCMQNYLKAHLDANDVSFSYIYSYPNKAIYKGSNN